MVTEATEPREIRILARGNFLDDSGAVVSPRCLRFWESSIRAAAARPGSIWRIGWSRRKIRLTARVYANRIWRQFFGIGIVKTLDDMGSQGEWPRHPELLDWLAAEFMHPQYHATGAHDWDMKHLVRTIVMSAAYRQSSAMRPELEEKDPDNRLIARQSRYRVDAEEVRDIELSVAGLLVEKFGGPSVKPYQPDGYLATLEFSEARICGESRRRFVPARDLYAVAEVVPPAEPAEFRCAEPGGVHGESGQFGYSAAGVRSLK